MEHFLLFPLALLALASTQVSGCRAPASSKTIGETENSREAVSSAEPPGMRAMAEKLLGSKVRVLLAGDLAHNGRYQVLLLDPRSPSTGDPASAVEIWRAALLEWKSTGWTELLRCDEYLKNSSGYLRGTPLAPVTGWRLQLGPDDKKRGRQLSFTPLQGQGIVPVQAVNVRWNPTVSRYQSVDATNQTFLGELPLLETPASELR